MGFSHANIKNAFVVIVKTIAPMRYVCLTFNQLPVERFLRILPQVLISPLPLYHIYAFTVSMNATLYGGVPFVTMQSFDLEKFLALVEK